MNFKALAERLGGLTETDLDSLLEARDCDVFESAWLEARSKVTDQQRHPDAESIFAAISEATGCHEITSYVCDDLDLLHSALNSGFSNPFLKHLEATYAEGEFPHKLGD